LTQAHGSLTPAQSTYLRFDQDQINKQHNKVMLDVFVGESFAPRTLRQANALAQSLVVRFAVGGVEGLHGQATSE